MKRLPPGYLSMLRGLRRVLLAQLIACTFASAFAQTPAAPAPPDPAELAVSIKSELTRIGCFDGAIDAEWPTPALKKSLALYARDSNLSFIPEFASPSLLDLLRGHDKRVCQIACKAGEKLDNGACVASKPPEPEKRVVAAPRAPRKAVRQRKPVVERKAVVRKAKPKPRSNTGGGCFEYRGQRFC